MKIVYTRKDSGVVAGGIFFAYNVPTKVPDKLGKELVKQAHFRVHRTPKRERTPKSKPEKEEKEKSW